MKRLVPLFALLVLFSIGAQAQIVGIDEGSSRQDVSYGSDLYQEGRTFTRIGNSIFFSAIGLGTAFGLIIDVDEFWAGTVAGAVIGGAVSTPFWIVGAVKKHNARNMSYVPILEQDFQLNDNLSLTTSLGMTNMTRVVPEVSGSQANGIGVGLSLNF